MVRALQLYIYFSLSLSLYIYIYIYILPLGGACPAACVCIRTEPVFIASTVFHHKAWLPCLQYRWVGCHSRKKQATTNCGSRFLGALQGRALSCSRLCCRRRHPQVTPAQFTPSLTFFGLHAKSGFEMCFCYFYRIPAPCVLGSQPKHVPNPRIKRFDHI